MGKGRRKRERQERREGKGRLVDLAEERKRRRAETEDRKRIAGEAVTNGPEAKPSPTAVALEDRPEYVAHMEAWEDAGFPTPGAA